METKKPNPTIKIHNHKGSVTSVPMHSSTAANSEVMTVEEFQSK